ncbi:hypothetical protein [Mucilaginibacter flavus]|uniref:hypothetical protein n=1 Tax=Mucilaginibacter flavus TaxID=931504 RepID=UPI0025B52A8D|nr:hypothetical protein [Mucilaginibacter flavus]MDN3581540.1 hypothetical protein [Mucilaginibacter flavus]
MKTNQQRFAYIKARRGSNERAKTSARVPFGYLFVFSLLITLYSCGKPTNNPPPVVVNPTGCAIATDIDQALGTRQFTYDDKGLLIKMTAPNFYYGVFTETISQTQSVDSYPSASVTGNGTHLYGIINLTNVYSGGSGNIYDGNPQFMTQKFVATNPASSLLKDSLFQYVYDDAKKHLTTILVKGNGDPDAEGFANFRDELNFTYDGNDNVTQVKIIHDFSKKTINYPTGDTRIDYKQISDDLLTISYDDKLSPYTTISRYWKFIGQDFSGYSAYNLDKLKYWAGRCAILSKNNPVKITGKLILVRGQPPPNIDATLTYQYNDKNLPISMSINSSAVNTFTYNCK